jgi:hypothetical protein
MSVRPSIGWSPATCSGAMYPGRPHPLREPDGDGFAGGQSISLRRHFRFQSCTQSNSLRHWAYAKQRTPLSVLSISIEGRG